MTSIYQIALGRDFERLHPKMQWRFGFSSADGVCHVGRGVMDEVWRGRFFTLPFLLLGSTRRVLFPARGRNVPFTLSNYAYVDGFGRETMTWARRFKMHRRYHAFDATMIYSESRGLIIDYLGTHQHLAVDIHCSVDDDGALCIRSGEQHFYEGRIGFRFPLVFSGVAHVREWWDDSASRFRIDVNVSNRVFGPLFGYRGSFSVVESACTIDDIPLDMRPLREEAREWPAPAGQPRVSCPCVATRPRRRTTTPLARAKAARLCRAAAPGAVGECRYRNADTACATSRTISPAKRVRRSRTCGRAGRRDK